MRSIPKVPLGWPVSAVHRLRCGGNMRLRQTEKMDHLMGQFERRIFGSARIDESPGIRLQTLDSKGLGSRFLGEPNRL